HDCGAGLELLANVDIQYLLLSAKVFRLPKDAHDEPLDEAVGVGSSSLLFHVLLVEQPFVVHLGSLVIATPVAQCPRLGSQAIADLACGLLIECGSAPGHEMLDHGIELLHGLSERMIALIRWFPIRPLRALRFAGASRAHGSVANVFKTL